MRVRIEELPSVDVVYCRGEGPYEASAPQAWGRLWAWARDRGLAGRVRGAYGFGLDDPTATAPQKLRYDACLAVEGGAEPDAEAGIGVQTLPGGRYGIYRLQGAYHGIGEAFGRLHATWLPESGETLEPQRPFLEIYLNDPAEVPESELLTDLCLPLRG